MSSSLVSLLYITTRSTILAGGTISSVSIVTLSISTLGPDIFLINVPVYIRLLGGTSTIDPQQTDIGSMIQVEEGRYCAQSRHYNCTPSCNPGMVHDDDNSDIEEKDVQNEE